MRLCRSLSFLVMAAAAGTAWAQATSLPVDRLMTFNDLPFLASGYYNAAWTHVGPPVAGSPWVRRLLAGTNHTHASGWKLTACRTGTSRWIGNTIPPDYYYGDPAKTNYQANLQNTLAAKIESPYYPDGIGTLYFEAINLAVGYPSTIAVELATNMLDVASACVTNLLLTEETEFFVYNWQTLDTLTPNAQSRMDFTRYQRLLNYRGAARFRIRRLTLTELASLDYDLVAVDNIRASWPPSDVAIRLPEAVCRPGHPSVGTNIAVSCYVDNLDLCVPTSNDLRTVSFVYRWRYLSQASNAWARAAMALADPGDGAGNGERYEALLPPQPEAGDLEYYLECAFDGYRYKPVDYTLSNYVYYANAEGSETLSPRVLRGSVAGPGELAVRVRPYGSPYGAVSVVADQLAEPIEMALTGDDEWRGLVPVGAPGLTNLTWQFRGRDRCLEDEAAFSPATVCWAGAVAGAGVRLPCQGVCTETDDMARLSLDLDACGYVQVTFNTRTRRYTARRAEYQNFNAWPALPDVFTESSAQHAQSLPSWKAYNAKVVSTDQSRVCLDESKACFLNNSRTLEADPVQDRAEPFLQTPVLTNGVGALSFQARAYSANESATLYLYASTNSGDASADQWVEIHRFEAITNTLYAAFSHTPSDGGKYTALRLGTATSEGSRRVCLEEVVVAEPAWFEDQPGLPRIPAGVRGDAAFYVPWLQPFGLEMADLSRLEPAVFEAAWLFGQNPQSFVSGDVALTDVSLGEEQVNARFAVRAVTAAGPVAVSRLNGRLALLAAPSPDAPFVEVADVTASVASGQLALPKSASARFLKLVIVFPE